MASPPSVTLQTPYFFFYGTLQSPAVFSRVVTGTTSQQVVSLQQMKPAIVHGYKRCPVQGVDYPAMIKGTPSDRVTGVLCLVSEPIWQKRLDMFEGQEYAREVVTASMQTGGDWDGDAAQSQDVEAYAYIWVHGEQYLDTDKEWSTERFMEERERLWAHGDEDRLLDEATPAA